MAENDLLENIEVGAPTETDGEGVGGIDVFSEEINIGDNGPDISLIDHIINLNISVGEVGEEIEELNETVTAIQEVLANDHSSFLESDINEYSITNTLLLFIFLLLLAQFILKFNSHVDGSMKIRKE